MAAHKPQHMKLRPGQPQAKPVPQRRPHYDRDGDDSDASPLPPRPTTTSTSNNNKAATFGYTRVGGGANHGATKQLSKKQTIQEKVAAMRRVATQVPTHTCSRNAPFTLPTLTSVCFVPPTQSSPTKHTSTDSFNSSYNINASPSRCSAAGSALSTYIEPDDEVGTLSHPSAPRPLYCTLPAAAPFTVVCVCVCVCAGAHTLRTVSTPLPHLFHLSLSPTLFNAGAHGAPRGHLGGADQLRQRGAHRHHLHAHLPSPLRRRAAATHVAGTAGQTEAQNRLCHVREGGRGRGRGGEGGAGVVCSRGGWPRPRPRRRPSARADPFYPRQPAREEMMRRARCGMVGWGGVGWGG